MRVVAIVQARMGSSRLPGKSAMPLCGKPLIWHVLNRVKQANVNDVVLALPEERDLPHEALVDAASSLDIVSFTQRGDPNDLIRRYANTAEMYNAEAIVRVPGDNPCVDPDEINRIIRLYQRTSQGDRDWERRWLWSNLDQNIAGNGYPGGLGAEVYYPGFMYWLDENVRDPRLREHPHLWAFERQRVATLAAHHSISRPHLRFDVNTMADFEFVKGIYDALYPDNHNFRTRDIISHLGESNGK